MNNFPIGAMTALITPFRNGKLDEITYEKLIKRQINYGIDAVVPVGTTGESATLSHDEHKRCIEIAVATCRGTNTRVMAGAGSNATHEAIELAKFAQKNGAHAILSITPYYNKPTQEGLYQHYKALANSIEIPLMLYNVPGRTGCDLLPETIFRLFKDCKNIYGVKEATGSMERCVDLLANEPDLCVLCGDDAINYPLLSNGAKGVISVCSNLLPDMVSNLTHLALEKDFNGAKKINDKLCKINKALFCESNPIPLKAAMFLSGLLETLEYRLPLVKPSDEHMKLIENTIKHYEIKGF